MEHQKFEKAKRHQINLCGSPQEYACSHCYTDCRLRIFPKLYDTSDEVRHLGQWFIIITASFFPVAGIFECVILYASLRRKNGNHILFDSIFTWVVSVSLAFVLCKFTALPIPIYIIGQRRI